MYTAAMTSSPKEQLARKRDVLELGEPGDVLDARARGALVLVRRVRGRGLVIRLAACAAGGRAAHVSGRVDRSN